MTLSEELSRESFSKVRVAQPTSYSSQMVKHLVEAELEKVDASNSSKPELEKKCADLGYVVASVASKLKSTIDLLMPQGFEYTLSYGCLMLKFIVCLHVQLISGQFI